MYKMRIQNPSKATSPRPRIVAHNKLDSMMMEIQIYQMSHMKGDTNMFWFEPSIKSGVMIGRISNVIFVVEAIPFEQKEEDNGQILEWDEIGEFYDPKKNKSSPSTKGKRKNGLKNPTIQIRENGKNWVNLYNPDDIFSKSFLGLLGLVGEYEQEK